MSNMLMAQSQLGSPLQSSYDIDPPHASGLITIINESSLTGTASLYAELAVGKNSKKAIVIDFDERPTYYFEPFQSKTVNFSFDIELEGFFERRKKGFVKLRVFTSGPAIDGGEIPFRWWFGHQCFDPRSNNVGRSFETGDTSFVFVSSNLSPYEVVDTAYTPSANAVASEIVLSWPYDSVQLHLYDDGGNHFGWNEVLGQMDKEIPGVVDYYGGISPQGVVFEDLSTAPYVIQVKSLSTDTLSYSISVGEEGAHPAVLGAQPDTIDLITMAGYSVLCSIELFEMGGQQDVNIMNVTITDFVHGEQGISTDSLDFGSFPLVLLADSLIQLSDVLVVPTDQDAGLYTGSIAVSSNAGNYTIPINLQVIPRYICGDANGDEAVNIFDITSLIAYLYMAGDPPVSLNESDVNSDGTVNIFDITYLITFLYLGGPEPNCP